MCSGFCSQLDFSRSMACTVCKRPVVPGRGRVDNGQDELGVGVHLRSKWTLASTDGDKGEKLFR